MAKYAIPLNANPFKVVTAAPAILFLLFSAFAQARADGLAYKGRDPSSFAPVLPNEQIAAIVHRDGIQHMIIALNLDMDDDENAVWIFPVRGGPDAVRVDVVDEYPRFAGHDQRVTARRRLHAWTVAAISTQLYTACLVATCLPTLGVDGGALVHGEAERWGLRVQTVSAATLPALARHAQSLGAKLASDDIASFAPYLDGGHTFVVASIKSREEVRREFPAYKTGGRLAGARWPCVYVRFPTDRIFYPMRATSGYGAEVVPVRLSIVGFVEPDPGSALAGRTRIGHYETSRRPTAINDFANLLPGPIVPYTSVRLEDVRADEFTSDLFFDPTEPPGMQYAALVNHVAEWRWATGLWFAYVGLLSYVSAGVAGLLTLHRWRGIAHLGLYNMLTLVAVWWVLRQQRLRLDADLPGNATVGERASARRDRADMKPPGRRFLITFSLIYVLLCTVTGWLLQMPLVRS